MDYVRTLTPREEALLSSKAAKDKTTIQAMLDTKIAQYLADCRRDMGQDTDAEIIKRLVLRTQAEKEALLATLPPPPPPVTA